jgi:hypothetical protein
MNYETERTTLPHSDYNYVHSAYDYHIVFGKSLSIQDRLRVGDRQKNRNLYRIFPLRKPALPKSKMRCLVRFQDRLGS